MTSDIINNDTICALATPAGGAIAIIRISGPEALTIASSICSGITTTTPANTIHFTRITDDSEIIDEAMISVFKTPHSYTGEDSAEISCHGSSYIIQQILNLLISKGCRMANPGEFTLRAYLNGKMDLSQAEAVADLIASTNKATHHVAMSQLRGHFSSELSSLRKQLLKLTSLLELELDFSEHEDLEFADRTQLLSLSQTIEKRITTLAQSFKTGQALKNGIPVTIIGNTNVGKSTLLNRLIHDDKAIVSDIHGTTRDIIEDTTQINGLTFRFIDTAGLRDTQDEIEQMGIKRSYKKLKEDTIVIWLRDKKPSEEEIKKMTHLTQGKKLIAVQNKIDLLTPTKKEQWVSPTYFVSAKHDIGINALEQAIYSAANIPEMKENDVIITSARHYDTLMQARENAQRVINGLESQLPSDLIAEDLRLVLSNLSEITGEGQITSQETLNNIFKHFCVGN